MRPALSIRHPKTWLILIVWTAMWIGLYSKYLASFPGDFYYQPNMAWYGLPTLTTDLAFSSAWGGTFFAFFFGFMALGMISRIQTVRGNARHAVSVVLDSNHEPIGEVEDSVEAGKWQQPLHFTQAT